MFTPEFKIIFFKFTGLFESPDRHVDGNINSQKLNIDLMILLGLVISWGTLNRFF